MQASPIITGCSSYNESYWKGVFYPETLPRKLWFDHYCKFFDTYELNATFYKFPTDKGLTAWYNNSPAGFLFSVKMYKGVTHFKKFNDCERLIGEFYDACRKNLKEKLACVLFQMPPSFSWSEQRMKLVLDSLDYSFKNVVEFRHISWWNENVYAALHEHGVVFCNVSYPTLPEEIVRTDNIGYVRLHGVPKLFYSGYSIEYLADLHDQITGQGWEKSFVYFNNTASESGIFNALEFKSRSQNTVENRLE